MSGINALIGRHPVVTFAMAGVMALAFLLVLAGEGGEGSKSAQSLEAVRTFYEQNAEVRVSARNRHLMGRDFVDVVSRAYEAQKDEGAGPIFFSERMQQRTQRKFETLADEAFDARMRDFPAWRFGVSYEGTPIPNYVVHVFAHESLVALVVSLIFLVVAGIGLEAAWGTAVFAGFCLFGTVLPAVAFRFLDAEGGVPLSGATGLVAALLAAYAVRGIGGGFRVPGWALMPVWLFVELFFVRGIWIDNFQSAPLAAIGVGSALGVVVALAMKLFKLEKKIVERAETSDKPSRHPALDLAERAAAEGNPGQALDALRAACSERPKDREIAQTYWDLARENGQAGEAVAAILPVLRDCVRGGESERAIALWGEITTYVHDVKVEPALVIRIGESLLDESQPDAALDALRRAVEHPRGLGTALAQRVVRVARDLDPDLTHRAAAIALKDATLDDATREALEALVDEVRAKAPPPPPRPAPSVVAPPPQRPPARADSDLDLDNTDELTDPDDFAQLNLGAAPDGTRVEPDLDDIDPNALSLQSLEREFSGSLGLDEGEELTDPDAAGWNDPSLLTDLGDSTDPGGALFDKGGLADTPIDESVATAARASVPMREPGTGSDTAPLAPLGSTPTAASNASAPVALGRISTHTSEPVRAIAPPIQALPPVGASPSIDDLAACEPSDAELDSLAAPTPPANELAAIAPPPAPPRPRAASVPAPAPPPRVAPDTAPLPPPRSAAIPPAPVAPAPAPRPPPDPAPPPRISPAPAPAPAPTPAPAARPAPRPGAGGSVSAPPPAVGRDLTDLVDFGDEDELRRIKVVQGVPVGVKTDALEIEVEGRGASNVPFARIDAVAVAAVAGLSAKPVLLIDLVLNWLDDPGTPLKVIRLQSNRFNPARLVPSATSPLDALKRLVDGVLGRSGGTPLPDPAAVAGSPFKSFPDVETYQRQVLGAGD